MHQLVSARKLIQTPLENHTCGWNLDTLRGRFIELSGRATTAALTASVELLREAQQRKTLAVWIGPKNSAFFPPDLQASGVDVAALPVIHVPSVQRACWTADILLRSGSFTLILMDIESLQSLSFSIQTRFIGLTQQHNATLIAITRQRRDATSLGSLVSLRGISKKHRIAHNCFGWEVYAEKDKQASTHWRYTEERCGPDGLY